MEVLRFVFYLGIINLVLGFLWKWVIALPLALLLLRFNFRPGLYIAKTIGYYLLVSLTAILTLTTVSDHTELFWLILYPLLGAIVLYMGFASNLVDLKKSAELQMIVDLEETRNFANEFTYEIFLLIGAIILYIVSLFWPVLIWNAFTTWLFGVVGWAYNLPVIGWIIGFAGVFMLLSNVFQGVLTLGFVTASVFDRFRTAKDDDSSTI